MSLFYNVSPQFLDATGTPYAGGKIYFGEPNVDPVNNPKTVYLDEALSVAASNPQDLNSFGTPSQGPIYMSPSPDRYSILLEDNAGNQIFNIPDVVGVDLPTDLTNIPNVILTGTVDIINATDAYVGISSGPAIGSESTVELKESLVSQWAMVRKAIVDGGALLFRNVFLSNDVPLELPRTGGLIARWLGTDRITVGAAGVAIEGRISGNNQVIYGAGIFNNAGTVNAGSMGITSVTRTGPGVYEVLLDYVPVDEAKLICNAQALNGFAPMEAIALGGAPASQKIVVYTYTVGTSTPADGTAMYLSWIDLEGA